jgi:DHA1 family multidrug resistance protein-like MFS transporter
VATRAPAVPGVAANGGTRTVVGAIVFAVAVAAFARVPLLPDIGVDLSLTAGEIGLLTTAFGLGRLAMDLPAGRLAARVEPTLALSGAGIGLAVSSALFAAAGSLGVALAASALIGGASALTNTTGMYAFATATAAERRGASMAIYTTALMSGQMVGPALGGALGSLTDWRVAIGASAAIGLGVAIACVILRPRSPAGSSGEQAEASPRASESRAAGPRATRPELIALAAAPFATFFGMAGLTQTLIPLIGAGELDLSASTIGFAVGGGAAARLVSAWFAGVASDRWSRKAVLVPLLIVMAIGAGLLALPITAAVWLASIVALAVGSSGISVAAAAVADRVDPRRLGHELGVFRLLGDLGLLVGPVVAAFLYQDYGPSSAAFVSAGVFALAALTAALWVSGPAAGRPDAGEIGEPILP